VGGPAAYTWTDHGRMGPEPAFIRMRRLRWPGLRIDAVTLERT
jgi:hypothetical protein